MKQKIWRTSLIFLTIFLVPSLSFAEPVGSFSRVEGRVDILKAGETSAVPVKSDDSVSMGDIVRTKSDGKAEITFKDDTTIRLAPETRMKLDEYVFNPDNSRKTGVLGLFRGKVRAVVSKTKGGIIPVGAGISSFNINTPTAVAGVRGTDFFVFHDRGITGVIFKEGSGFVANPNMPDKIVHVNAGQVTFVVSTNIPPSPPRPATNIELAAHTKDTTPAEKPKEKKEEGEKPKEEKAKTVEAKAEDKKEEKEKKEDKKEGGTKTAETKTEESKTEEKKGDEQKPKQGEPAIKEAKAETQNTSGPAAMITNPVFQIPIGGGDILGAGAADAVSIPTAITTSAVSGTTVNTLPVNLLPVTETHPNLLTDVTINLKFP
ncbi:MAG: FecR domain-containing protein [Nitrospinae bacterium]|nr:FecR domain-containing protein [Nitrospinota bacterium]